MAITTQQMYPKGSEIYGRKGTKYENVAGVVVGGYTRCSLEGCRGSRVWVRWPGGHLTKPCTKGLEEVGRKVRIL